MSWDCLKTPFLSSMNLHRLTDFWVGWDTKSSITWKVWGISFEMRYRHCHLASILSDRWTIEFLEKRKKCKNVFLLLAKLLAIFDIATHIHGITMWTMWPLEDSENEELLGFWEFLYGSYCCSKSVDNDCKF